MKKVEENKITNGQASTLFALIGKLKTKSLGLDDLEKLLDEKRNLRAVEAKSSEMATELVKNLNIKFKGEDMRFFDMEATTKEDREAFNSQMVEFQKKDIFTSKFLTKKNLQALVHENDLSIDEYELLTDAFLKGVTDKPAE